MRKKKTRNGVEISQTRGMRQIARSSVWVLVMDRAQARLYDWNKRESTLSPIEKIVHPTGRLKASALVSDRPGRTFDSWGRGSNGQRMNASRHGYSESDPSEHELGELAAVVSKWLETGHASNVFTQLILVAEPRCLGRLKAKLSGGVLKTIQAEHRKDFSWLEEETLTQRLERELTQEQVA